MISSELLGGNADVVNAYVFADATGGTPVINKAFNVSSITDNGVGIFILNFTRAVASTNYTVAAASENAAGGTVPSIVYEDGSTARTTTTYPMMVANSNNNRQDNKFSVVILGA